MTAPTLVSDSFKVSTSWASMWMKRKLRQFIPLSCSRDYLLLLLWPPDGAEHVAAGPRHLLGVRGALRGHQAQAVWPAARGLQEGRHWSLHVRWWWGHYQSLQSLQGYQSIHVYVKPKSHKNAQCNNENSSLPPYYAKLVRMRFSLPPRVGAAEHRLFVSVWSLPLCSSCISCIYLVSMFDAVEMASVLVFIETG